MSRSYHKNIIRTFRSTKSRFLAIFSIVALGVGFLAGLMSTTPDMRDSMEEYLDSANFHDLRVISTLGLSDGDLAALRAVPGVRQAQGAYALDLLITCGADTLVARAQNLPADPADPDAIDRLTLEQGRWPAAPGECVVAIGANALRSSGPQLGESFAVSPDNEDLSDALAREQFTVVGLVRSANYFSIEREAASVGDGNVAVIFYLQPSDFAYDVYTDIYLTVDGAFELASLGQPYKDAVQAVGDRIEAIEDERAAARLEEVRADARQEIDDGWAEYNDARAEADEEFAKAEQELADARAELADGEAQYADGQQELADAEKELADGERELADGRRELADGRQELADAEQQLANAQAQYDAGVAQLEEGEKQLDEAEAQLKQGWEEYETGAARLADAAAQLNAGEAQYADGVQQMADKLGGALQDYQAFVPSIPTAKEITEALAELAGLPPEEIPADDAALGKQFLAPLLGIAPELLDMLETIPGTGEQIQGMVQEAGAYVRLLIDSRRTLDAGWQEYNAGAAQLEPALRTLEAAGRELREQTAVFYQGKRELEDAKAQLDAGYAELERGRAELADAEQKVRDGEKELADGRKEVADGKAELADAWQEILDGRAELADGEAEYAEEKADAEAELADAKQELLDAEAELNDLEAPTWYIRDRGANTSFNSFEGNVNKVEAIARVFPIFFFLVAALVVSTTMTRMVEEERLQIGTMKALGYDRPAIMQKYIRYALTAAVLGALAGLALGFAVFPSVIWYAYEMMYYMPHLATPWRAEYAMMAGGLLIGCALVATLSACWATLRETPAALMRPRAPRAGKRIFLERITPLWRRLPFTYKVTCRNLLRYKKRFWMTVLGVAGCTALLVTGFGISDSLNGIAIKQYGELFRYGLLTAVTDSEDTQRGEVHDYLFGDPDFPQSLAVCTELVSQEMPDGSFNEVYLMAPQDAAAFNDFVDLHERISRTPTPLADDGLVLTEKLADTWNVQAGDTVTLENADGQKADFTVSGVCEHYVMNYAYIGPAAWQRAYGAAPAYNAILSMLADDSANAHADISAALLRMDGVAAVNFTTDQRTAVLNMLNSINAVVVLIIVCAASLAFVVLYNLTNINIAERVKEIATIKVLGFYDREVSAYVNRESIALTVIGALLGLLGGIGLHKFVIYTVEVDAVMFGRTIRPVSFLYALALTMLFSTIVDLVMGRKLKSISMVESMKAPE